MHIYIHSLFPFLCRIADLCRSLIRLFHWVRICTSHGQLAICQHKYRIKWPLPYKRLPIPPPVLLFRASAFRHCDHAVSRIPVVPESGQRRGLADFGLLNPNPPSKSPTSAVYHDMTRKELLIPERRKTSMKEAA